MEMRLEQEQCKTCDIINADCEGCKAFNKNIKNLDLETKEQKIKQIQNLKDMKNKYLNRKVEFWVSGYPNSLNTHFSDDNLQENKNTIIVGGKKNKLVDLLLDTVINYLEQELKEYDKKNGYI